MDRYAGQWIDNLNGGVLVVAVAEPRNHDVESKLQELMPRASDVRVVSATYSLGQVTAWKSMIRREAEAAGVGYVLALNEPANLLDVGLENPSVVDLSRLPADAYQLVPYGGVENASANLNVDHGADAHPGLRIGVYDYAGNNGQACTWSFNAHDTAGTNFLITAAHCTDRWVSTGDGKSYTTDIWQPNKSGTRLGNNARGYNRRTSKVDAARIKDMNSYTDDNCFHTNTNECYQITSRQLLSQDQRGDIVCGALAVSNKYRCRELLYRDVDADGMTNLRKWDYYPSLGDSGAGMKYGHQARGVLVKRDNGDDTGLYTHIYYNVYYLGLTLNGT